MLWISDAWKDYEVLDATGGERLERWGDHILVRPDPQVIWNTPRTALEWKRYDARYVRSNTGGGVATPYCAHYPDAAIGTVSLVKLNHGEITAIRSARNVGLSADYVTDGYVYYDDVDEYIADMSDKKDELEADIKEMASQVHFD